MEEDELVTMRIDHHMVLYLLNQFLIASLFRPFELPLDSIVFDQNDGHERQCNPRGGSDELNGSGRLICDRKEPSSASIRG